MTQNLQSLLKKGYLVKTDDNEYELHQRYLKKKTVQVDSQLEEPLYGGIPIRGIISAGYLQEAVESNLGNITLKHLFPKSYIKLFWHLGLGQVIGVMPT